jgi:glycosidase
MSMKYALTSLVISWISAASLIGCELLPESIPQASAGSSSGAAAGASSGGAGSEVDELQIASPAWQDQIIYFVMTDRFNDGDPGNNDQGAGEYNPKDQSRYSGGDLQGVIDKLDYISGLGATAVWVTPPVANQWVDPLVNYTGYQGYWAENFKEFDKHYGSLGTYKSLSSALHGKGMYLIQDVVVNHTGNFFRYSSYNPSDVTAGFILNTKSLPHTAPTLSPFNLNDVRKAEDRSAAIYHWTPVIADYQDKDQLQSNQLSDLDDLNTENPVVAGALRDAYRYWIKEVGVDAFRLDTALNVPASFYGGFVNSTAADNLGVREYARALHDKKSDFIVFGETFVGAKPYDDSSDKLIDTLIQDSESKPLLSSTLNFPLHVGMQDAFASGHPTAALTFRLNASMKSHKNPYLMVNFLDNHDKARFLTIGTEAGLKQALLFMLTTPGIPAIYYGTEQGFTGQRDAMFKGGVGSGGKDHFDPGAPLYTFIHDLAEIRKKNEVLRRGAPAVLKDSAAGPGVFAYRMSHGAESAFVILNTADQSVLLDNLPTGLPAGTVLRLLKGLTEKDGDAVVSAGGLVSMALGPRAGMVLLATDTTVQVPIPTASVTLDLPATTELTGDTALTGTLTGSTSFKLVVDGALSSAQTVTAKSDGTWQAVMSVDGMTDKTIKHAVVAYIEDKNVLSSTRTFTVNTPFVVVAEVTDPLGDDTGPAGKSYGYPTDATYAPRQMDIAKATLSAVGTQVNIGLQMKAISTVWSPFNDFDHVAFTIYLGVPGQPGLSVMPNQNASVPSGMTWSYEILTSGWLSALYSAEGASATSTGKAISPAAKISVDKPSQTVNLQISGKALGLTTLKGAQIYITTWDYDGGYRPLSPLPEQWKMSGGDGGKDPLIMDDVPVLSIP